VKRSNAALVACVLAAVWLMTASVLPAVAQDSSAIDGVVADAQSGLPLPGALVVVLGTPFRAQTNTRGAFRLTGLVPAIERLRLSHEGYQTAESDDIVLADGETAHVTLSLNVISNAQSGTVIGHSATRASDSLQGSSTISRTLSTETLADNGYYRAADALRQLPGVTNSITGDTGALGDDVPLDIRGLGAAETVTTLDGHPLASGASGGFNFQISPLTGIRSYRVIYGTGGGDALGVNAVGGVMNAQTIDPTRAFAANLSQIYGSDDRLGTSAQVTGTTGRLGFAAAAGVYGEDGPLHDATTDDPAVSWDPSSSEPAIVNAATYTVDSAAVSRTLLAKLRYALSPATALTFTSFSSTYWENKTGNGDQDYQTGGYELAAANKLLTKKTATDPCPAGSFQAINSYGVPWGTGPNGLPDGGAPNGCVTPAEYAVDATGPAGAGPAYQTIGLNDDDLNLTSTASNRQFELDLDSNRYLVIQSRADGLPDYVGTSSAGGTTFPYVHVSGTGGAYKNSFYLTSGGHIAESFLGRHNDATVGVEYSNASDSLTTDDAGARTAGNSNAFYWGPYVRDTYRLPTVPLTIDGNAYFLHASATNTSYVNPRLALVYTPGSRDVVRASIGASTTQPTANYLDQPFVPSNAVQSIIGSGGGGKPACSSFSVGSAPSSILKPERGVDEEIGYGHRFWADTQIEATVFNENVYDKIFSGITVPIDLQRPPFAIASSVVNGLTTALDAYCGIGGATTVITETANLGQLRTRGIMLNGRIRADSRVFVDYDYAVTSTSLVSGVAQLLEKNLTYVPGAQLPRVPLQTFTVALDARVLPRLEARFDFNTVSADNTKALPAYSYSDVGLTTQLGPVRLSGGVTNLFNQWTESESLENSGVPLALNPYATASSYAAETGTAATEALALEPRMIFINVVLPVR
jgi:outer membrane receptor for ferrienterochelin and colicin